jgi:8-oxo-dGTP pyrophosphatase MutT (NUDIX family)
VPTSVRVVLADRDGRLLLLQRAADDDIHPGLWEFPGGGIDPGETAAQAAARELSEEVGLDLGDLALAAWDSYVRTEHGRARDTAFYRAECDASDCSPKLSREHDAWRWTGDDGDLPPLTPSTRWALERRA